MDEAVCLRRRFERLNNGSYICSEFSSGLWFRCIADHGDHFEHVDGGGEVGSVPSPSSFRCLRVRTSAVRICLRGALGELPVDSSISQKGAIATRVAETKGGPRRASKFRRPPARRAEGTRLAVSRRGPRRKAGQSGRLDSNQRPFGPQPTGGWCRSVPGASPASPMSTFVDVLDTSDDVFGTRSGTEAPVR